jgi:hypothetical protein
MKLTESIRVHLDDATAEAFRQRARRAGCQPGELLRDIICLQEWGRTWGEHVAHHRRATLAKEGPMPGPSTGPWRVHDRVAERAPEPARSGPVEAPQAAASDFWRGVTR